MKKQIGLIILHHLRFLAIVQLAKIKLIQQLKGKPLVIVGITGSAGKTSTMLAAQTILEKHFRVKTNYGANSESGIPLNILGLHAQTFSLVDWLRITLIAPLKLLTNWQTYEIYIVEMGIDEPTEPKNMSYLLRIIKPHIAVLLGVNPVHSQQFDNTVPTHIKGNLRLKKILQNIALEKAKIINQNPSLSTAIINTDDQFVNQSTPPLPGINLITMGKNREATIQTLSSSCGPNGFTADFLVKNKKYRLSLPGHILPHVYHISFAASLAIAQTLGVEPQTAIRNLSEFHPPLSRSGLLKGIKQSLIIDSSYNSSPGTTQEMLTLLKEFPRPRIAILGDMRELGRQSPQSHKSLYLASLKIADLIIAVGPETCRYFGPKANKFIYWWQAADYLKNNLPSKSTILVKGSQNTIFLEELIKEIIANPADISLLCRQSPYWLKTKSTFRSHNS